MSGMRSALCALNKLKDVDIAFFIVCAAIIVLIVGIYFLIPVFNKKLYKEQRENLKKREAAFKTNLQSARAAETVGEKGAETAGEDSQAEQSKQETEPADEKAEADGAETPENR